MPRRPDDPLEPIQPLEPAAEPGASGSARDDTGGAPPATPSGATPRETKPLQSERYEISALLGAGGMGKVYKAFDRKLKRLVALKFLRGADAALEDRFLQEAQAQARVDHGHVCKVFDVGRLGEEPYIAMQYIEGPTLRDAAKEMTQGQKIAAVRDIAHAVHGAHEHGLIHRDIKPANILLERKDGEVWPFICDFGLARDLGERNGAAPGAAPLGTPPYMAPEQARSDNEKLDARTDVYGLGATLYEALTGKPPFEGATHMQTLYKLTHEEPLPARKLEPSIPVDLNSVVMKCLEKDPARRYPTARALARDLERTLAGEPVEARRIGRAARLWRSVQRNKALSASLLALALVAGVPLAWRALDRGSHVVVAVADFDNQTGDQSLDGLSGLLITSLEQSRKLSVVTRSRMFDLLRKPGRPEVARIDEALGREAAQKANAQALVLASIRKFDTLYVIDLKLLDPRTNRYVVAVQQQGTGKANLPKLIDSLSAQARRALRETEIQTASVSDVTTLSLEAYGHYFRGEQLIEDMKFSRAADELSAATRIDPSFALAFARLAYAEMWRHDGQRAREAIARATPSRLPEKERLMARGVAATVNGRGQEAYEAFKECAERYPTEKECVFAVGDLIFHAGYFTHAVDYLRRALVLDPGMDRAHQHLIWADQLLGRSTDLLADAREYVGRDGSDEAYAHLSRAFATLGQLPEARATIAKARQLFPHSALPAVDSGALDAWQFEVDRAISSLAPVLSQGRPAADRVLARLTLGGALVQGGRIREALSAFDAAAEDARAAGQPEQEAAALAQEATVRFLYLGDADGARKIASDAAARGVPEALFGFVYPLMGDLDKYDAVLRSAGDPLVEPSVAVFRNRVKGDHAKAAELLESLSDKSPYQDFLYYVLADSYAQAQKHERAIERLKKAQLLFPGAYAPGPGFGGVFRARSDYQLGVLYERTGQKALALESTQRFLKAWAKADPELPALKDARERAARLGAAGSILLR